MESAHGIKIDFRRLKNERDLMMVEAEKAMMKRKNKGNSKETSEREEEEKRVRDDFGNGWRLNDER